MDFDRKYDVCVFGGCALDQTYFQKEDGSYNDKPDALYNGGKGANQAVAAARAGAKVAFISKIGNDEIGMKILDNLKYNNIDVRGVEIVDGLENDYADIYIDIAEKDNEIIRHGNCIDSFTPDMVERNKDIILNSTIVVCQLKCPIEVTEALLEFCNKHNKKVILTPCRPKKLIGRQDLIDKVSYITCNREECKTVFETDDIEACIRKYPNKLIVTLGSEGLIYFDGKNIAHLPRVDVEVLDTTGAGDTLAGNLACQLSQGMDLMHSLRRGMFASTMSIQTKSAQGGMPYKEELDQFIERYRVKDFEYKEELELANNIVREANFRIKSNKEYSISVKEDNTLVTNIDVDTENFIIEEIKKKYPNDNFLTEENNPEGDLIDRTWVIDPIDGTSQFINNSDDWGIQMAFFDKGSIKFSVIYLPRKDEFYYAAEGQGAFLNHNRIYNRQDTRPLRQCIIEFSGRIEKELSSKVKVFLKLHEGSDRLVADFKYVNASCVAFTDIAKGVVSGLVLSTKKYWDIMPGLLICRESGIKLYPMDFENKLSLLTSNENVKNQILKVDKSKVKKLD